MSSRRYSLIVFDLDGTLVDSRRDIAESANAVLKEAGGRPHREEAIQRMVGDGAATLIARVFDAADLAKPANALDRFLEIYNARLLRHTRCYGGIPELLATLHDSAPLAVLTNKPLSATFEILEGLKLAPYFTAGVLGGDGPLPRKPDPQGLAHLIAQAGVEPARTLMVGDSIIDWRTADAAGAVACLARYGFGADEFSHITLRPQDFVVDHPLEILAHL